MTSLSNSHPFPLPTACLPHLPPKPGLFSHRSKRQSLSFAIREATKDQRKQWEKGHKSGGISSSAAACPSICQWQGGTPTFLPGSQVFAVSTVNPKVKLGRRANRASFHLTFVPVASFLTHWEPSLLHSADKPRVMTHRTERF